MGKSTPRSTDLLKLIRVLRECTSSLVPDTLYGLICNAIHRELGPYYLVSLFRVQRDQGFVATVANAGESLKEFEAKYRGTYTQSIQVGVTGHVARTGSTHLVRDTSQDPLFHFPDWTPPATRSELCVPVKSEGETIALINIESKELDAFPEEEVALLELLAEHLGQCIRNAQLHEALLQGTNRYREAMHRARWGQHKLAALLTLVPGPPLVLDAAGNLAAVLDLSDGVARFRSPAHLSPDEVAVEVPAAARAWREALDAAARAGGAAPFALPRKGPDGSARPLPGRIVLTDARARSEILFVPDPPAAS